MDRITGLQVTSPDLNGRESEIPLSIDLASKLEEASDFLMVNLYLNIKLIKWVETTYVYGDKALLFQQAGIYTPAGFFYPHYDEAYDGDDVKSRKRIASSIIYVRYSFH